MFVALFLFISTAHADQDADGVPDDFDNCPLMENANQVDSDGDSIGNACDACPNVADDGLDIDADGWGDACDVCPHSADDQLDTDGDGVGDLCDVCPEDADDACNLSCSTLTAPIGASSIFGLSMLFAVGIRRR